MDDLDHSVHIAERDWEEFYEESEECCLQQPALAGLDDSSLSDSEDIENPLCPAPDTGQHLQQSTAPNDAPSHTIAEESREAEGGCASFTDLPMQICQSGTEAIQLDDQSSLAEEGVALLSGVSENSPETQRASGIHAKCSGGNKLTTELIGPEETADKVTDTMKKSTANDHTLRAQQLITLSTNDQCSAALGSTINIEQKCHTDTAACERDSSEAPRREKERWFVTVNDSQMPQQVRSMPSAKKKRRKKQPCRNSVHRGSTSEGQDPPPESGSELERDGITESEGQVDINDFTQACHNSIALPNAHISNYNSHRSLSSDPPPFGEEDNFSLDLPLERSDSSEALVQETSMDNEKYEKYSSAVCLEKAVSPPATTLHDMGFIQRDPESEELKDDVEFFSTTSYDSDDYISATESAEETQHLNQDCLSIMHNMNIKLFPHHDAQCNISPTTLLSHAMCSEDAHISTISSSIVSTPSASGSSLPLEIARANLQPSSESDCFNCPMPHQCDGYEITADQAYLEPAKTFPITGHSNPIMPEDSSMAVDSKHSSLSHMTSETPAHKTDKPLTDFEHLAKAEPSPPPLYVTETPSPMTESPETCINALDSTRPVYAISAFWDEMEKLTIKDILQLRVARSPSPTSGAHDPQATASAQADVKDAHMQNSSLVDTAEFLLPDSTLGDTSDGTDSDYFTHIDDSKPDRSSCEFSTFSDFDEEYLQFIGNSTDPSPEPQELKQQSQTTDESPCLTVGGALQDEEINPIGLETHFDCELSMQCSDEIILNTLLSEEVTCLKGMTKSKSMRNIKALEVEIQLNDIHLQSIIEEAGRSLFLSNCFEENPFLEVNDGITRTPSPILPNRDILHEPYNISFPEIFEYLFEEDEPIDNSRAVVSVYDSQSYPDSETYDYSLSKYDTGMIFPPLVQRSQFSDGETVPIFSCSRSKATDLTFPELDELFFPQDTYAELEEEDDSSPIRVVTRSDIQAKDAVSSSAAPDGYPNLFSQSGWRRNWTSLFSLRRICFPGKGSSWCRRSGAWVFPAVAQRATTPIKTSNQASSVVKEGTVTPPPPKIIHLGHQIFKELAEQQRKFRNLQTTVSLSKRDGILFTLKQSDMCLVCIAFASWVLKSSDPGAADTWKAALLANVSAISAIQYLRRYVKKKESTEDDP